MNRDGKAEVVSFLQDRFSSAVASFLIDYKGLSVGDMRALRVLLRKDGGTLRVAKVRLMIRALSDIEGGSTLFDALHGQLGVVFADEPSGIAKCLVEFAKKHDAVSVKAGLYDSKLLSIEAIEALGSLPSKEVLAAMCARALSGPARGLACALDGVAAGLARALQGVVDKKKLGVEV